MTLFCIADADTVRGFRLAGVPGSAVTSAREAASALADAAQRPGLGLIVLTHDVAAGIRAQVDAFRLERELPLLVEVPGPTDAGPAPRSLGRLAQAAVGLRWRPETED